MYHLPDNSPLPIPRAQPQLASIAVRAAKRAESALQIFSWKVYQ
ncbi:hypothetical protein ECN1_3146 [Escherichia coli N1]|nr:hypothetical protein ECN1_3146 [Escherichia coli N1]